MANATATTTTVRTLPAGNPLLSPLVYWRVSALALTAVALLGIVLASISGGGHESTNDQALAFGSHHFLGLTWTHNVVHVVLALAAFLFGFGPVTAGVARGAAMAFGVIYLGLGVLGFFLSNPLGDGLALNLGVSLNVVHLVLGSWGLASGIAAR